MFVGVLELSGGVVGHDAFSPDYTAWLAINAVSANSNAYF